MPKISKITKRTFNDVVKERKLAERISEKEKQESLQIQKELQFDKFIKNTAKDILQKSPTFKLQVFDADAKTPMNLAFSDNSIWAPWSALFKK